MDTAMQAKSSVVDGRLRSSLKKRFARLYRLWVLFRRVVAALFRGRVCESWDCIAEYLFGYEIVFDDQKAVCQAVGSALALTGATEYYLLDVGASYGWFVSAMSRAIRIAGATCYEPLPDAWPAPKLGRLAADRCRFRYVAVGSKIGDIEIFRANHPGLSSVLSLSQDYQYEFSEFPVIEAIEKRTVPQVTLDDDFDPSVSNGLPILLKIDTQGSELDVLEGARKLLKPEIVAVVTLELMVKTKYQYQSTIEQVVSFLGDLGYEIFDIQKGYMERTRQTTEYDFTFCHRQFLQGPR